MSLFLQKYKKEEGEFNKLWLDSEKKNNKNLCEKGKIIYNKFLH